MLLINKNFFCKYNVLLVSSGGSGCTYLNKQIKKHVPYINSISNIDQFKHLYSPNSHLMHYNQFDNIIFLYNNPLNSILSHFRRGWAIMQHKQICPIENWIDLRHLKNQTTYFEYVIQTQQDGFGVIDHARRWANYPKCMFVDFRDIKETEKRISEKLGIKLKLEVKNRNSNLNNQNIPKEVIYTYNSLDQRLLGEINYGK